MTPPRSRTHAPADTAPLETRLAEYVITLKAGDRSVDYITERENRIRRVAADCQFDSLADFVPAAVEAWLVARKDEQLSARTRNQYLGSIRGMANWAVERGLLDYNPLLSIKTAPPSTDRRHVRRAFTDDELARVLFVTRWRPLANRGRKKLWRCKPASDHRTWKLAPLTFEGIDDAVARAKRKLPRHEIARLDRRGLERYTFIKLLATTGLRRNEARKLTLAWLQLDGENPTVEQPTQKNKKPLRVPLRHDIAQDLRHWVATMAKVKPDGSPRRSKKPLPPSTPVFDLYENVLVWFKGDLAVASVEYKDSRGRVADIHSLRKTFGTNLAKADVSLRYAQELLRHSDPKLTAGIYQDAGAFDLHGAVEQLPEISLDNGATAERRHDAGRVATASPGRRCAAAATPETNADGLLVMSIDPVKLVEQLSPDVRRQVAEAIERLDGLSRRATMEIERERKRRLKSESIKGDSGDQAEAEQARPPITSPSPPVVDTVPARHGPPRPPEKPPSTLGPLVGWIIDQRDLRPNTLRNYQQTWRLLVRYFGDDRPVESITADEAEDFCQWLAAPGKASKCGLTRSTLTRHIKRCRQFLAVAVRHRLIIDNPFQDITAGAQVVKDRFTYIDRRTIQRVLGACPNTEWRLIVALVRFAGLRCPGEVQAVRWSDVDWTCKQITVTYAGSTRTVPILPELRPHLVAAQRESGDQEHLVHTYRRPTSGASMWTRLTGIIRTAGIKPWPKLFENMRRSHEADQAGDVGAVDTLTTSQRQIIADALTKQPTPDVEAKQP